MGEQIVSNRVAGQLLQWESGRSVARHEAQLSSTARTGRTGGCREQFAQAQGHRHGLAVAGIAGKQVH